MARAHSPATAPGGQRAVPWLRPVQIHAFGNTRHAFMVQDARRPEAGIVYDERAATRAWQGAQESLEESLGR